MTKKEFFTAVINAGISPEVTEQAKTMLDGLNRAYANRKPSKTHRENEALYPRILELTHKEGLSASDLAAALGISPQKASGVARSMIQEGLLESEAVKTGGKKATALVYKAVAAE